jgi:tRNA isopentenyl-2-thiomethyl-A-37 hydroxylase MiaE
MRNRLSELALQALGDDFAIHGAAVIERVRTEEPTNYLRIVASLMPRQLSVERISPLSDFSDDEINELEKILRSRQAKLVKQMEKLEQQSGAVLELEANVADSDTEDKITDISPVASLDDADIAGK